MLGYWGGGGGLSGLVVLGVVYGAATVRTMIECH